MKTVFHSIFVFLSVCSAIAGDITVQSFPLKTQFPHAEHLLEQPPVMRDGKKVTVPYMLCGVFTKQQIQEYCDTSESKKSTSKSILPNGAVCHVAFVSEDTTTEPDKVKIKINISGPENQNMQSEISTFFGQGILLRCETGKDPKKAEIVVLQIERKNR